MDSANNKSSDNHPGGKVDITASVLAVGFFICLQIQEEEKIVLPYSIVQSTNSKWAGSLGLGTLSKLMELAREECRNIVTGNTSYCFDPKVIPFSQVIIASASDKSSVTTRNTGNEMKSKIKGIELNPTLFYSSTCILSMQNNLLEGLGKALSIEASNINLSDVILEVENVISRSGLHGLKTQLTTHLVTPAINTGNIYLDCMWLIHNICSIRLLMTYASVDDYSSRLLGIVLAVAGLELQSSSLEHSIVILTWNREEEEGPLALHDILKMTEAKVICAVYPSSNVNLDEIASSLVPTPFSPIADSIATMSKWTMPSPIYKQLRDEYWEIAKGTLTQNNNMDFLSWAVDTCRNRDVLYLLLLSFAIKRCMQLDIFKMHWQSKLSSYLFMKLTVKEERRLLLDDAQILGIVHRYPLESFRPNTFTLSPLKGQAQSYIKFMTCVLSLLDPVADLDDISEVIQKLMGEDGEIADKDHKQLWKEKGLSFPRKIAFKHCTQLTVDRISFLLKGLQMNINASLLLFELVFHGVPLSHQEISNIIAFDNHVMPCDEDSPFLSVRTKCKVCYGHAMDTATTLFTKSINVIRLVTKEKLSTSNLTDQEKARVTALVNFKVDEYLPAAIARLLFNKFDSKRMNISNSNVDESTESSVLLWMKVPYMNKCQCDGRPQHVFFRSCLFCGLDAIYTAKHTQLIEPLQSLLFSSCFAHENSDSVVNEFIDFFHHMIRVVINDKTCSEKNERKRTQRKGGEQDDLSKPNLAARDNESNSGSDSVHKDTKCDKQKISKNSKTASRFVLDSVEVDARRHGNKDINESDESDECDESETASAETDDLITNYKYDTAENNAETVHIDNSSDDNQYDEGNEDNSKVDLRFKNVEAKEKRINLAEARLLNRGNPQPNPTSLQGYTQSLSAAQVIEIAKKFDPKGSFSLDLSSFLQWMFSFSTGPSLMIINDFAQQQDSNFLPSNPSCKQNERNNINIPSLTDINNEEVSNNCKVTSGTALLDESVEEEDVQHSNRERNDDEYMAPPQKASVIKKRVQQKNQDKSGKDPPVEKALDKLSASIWEEKIKTSSVSDKKNRKNKSKDNDAKSKAGTKYPVIKKLKTKDNDHRMFAEFFSKK